MDDRIKVIREALDTIIAYDTEYKCDLDTHEPDYDNPIDGNCGLFARKARAALDSLAMESGDDARELVREYIELATTHDEYGVSKRRALELFDQLTTADRERVRAEERKACEEKLRAAFFRPRGPYGYLDAKDDEDALDECEALCAAILAPKEASHDAE